MPQGIGNLESLGALTGLVNDQALENAKKRAALASQGSGLLDQIQGRGAESVFGSSLLDALVPNGAQAGPGPGGAPAMPPGQPSAPGGAAAGGGGGVAPGGLPGPATAPSAGGGLSWPMIAQAVKARAGGNGQLAAAALQKFLPFLQQQSQEKTADALFNYRTAQANQMTGTGANAMSEADKDFWADVIRRGGSLPPGLTRTSGGAQLVRELMTRVPKGGSAGDLLANKVQLAGDTAVSRTAGTRGANIDIGVQELQRFAPMALAASQKVSRSKYPDINAMEQAVSKGLGDADIVRFVAANNALVTAYSQVIARNGTPTDMARSMAKEVISTAFNNGQYAAVVDQIMKEAKGAQEAPGAVRKDLRANVAGQGAPAVPEPAAARPSATGPNGEKVEFDGSAWVPVQ